MSKFAVIALGSNLGDRKNFLEFALEKIFEKCDVIKVSSIYESKPWGYANQGDFLNAAICVSTKLSPEELLDFLKSIEKDSGRIKTIINGPRTLDLDIIFYEDFECTTDALTLPHPKWNERDFVISPLWDLLEEKNSLALKKYFEMLLVYPKTLSKNSEFERTLK